MAVAFDCEVKEDVIKKLEFAKERAQETDAKNGYTILLGEGHRRDMIQVRVGRTGTRGGYAYIVHTDWGEFHVKSVTKRDWSVRFECGSLEFVKHNSLEKIADKLLNDLLPLFTEKVYAESLARVDYAVDFFKEGFKLDFEKFDAINSVVRPVPEIDFDPDQIKPIPQVRNGKAESVTIGKNPFRQMCFYNKRKEAITRKKEHFFKIWQEQMPELDRDNKDHIVWRCEMRMYKRYLSEKLGLYTFKDFLEKGVNAFVELFSDIQYFTKKVCNKKEDEVLKPMKIWQEIRDRFKLIFKHKWTGEIVRKVTSILKGEKVRELQTQGFGCVLSSLAINLQDIDGTIEQLEEKIFSAFKVYCRKNFEKIPDVLKRAGRRYQFKGDLSRMAVLDANLAEMMEGAC